MKTLPLLVLTSFLLPVASTLFAQATLVQWPLDNGSWTPTILDTSLVKGATGGVITGNFAAGSAKTDFYIASNDGSLKSSYADAQTGAHVRLQVRVQDDVTLDPGTLTFDIALQNISGGSYAAYTAGYALFVNDGVNTYSVKTSDGQDFASISIGSSVSTIRSTASFDLSSVAGLVTSGNTLLRFNIYIFTDGTYAGLNDKQVLRIDNIALNSAASVPEPSTVTMLLAGAAGVAVAVMRRIRR